MPGAPLFRRTATRPRHNTSSRKTLSNSAWNLRPGSALAARYSACCKARTGSRTADPETVGLAEPALTGPLLLNTTHRPSSGPSLTAGCVVRSARSALRPPPTPTTRHAAHFPARTGYRTRRCGDTLAPRVTGPGRASPVPAATIDAFRAPYAGESFTAALQALHRFHGLHPEIGGSALPVPHPPGQDV